MEPKFAKRRCKRKFLRCIDSCRVSLRIVSSLYYMDLYNNLYGFYPSALFPDSRRPSNAILIYLRQLKTFSQRSMRKITYFNNIGQHFEGKAQVLMPRGKIPKMGRNSSSKARTRLDNFFSIPAERLI